MAYADRVQETTTSSGSGNIALAGAATNFRTFSSVFGINESFEYAIVDSVANLWEVGRGYLSGATTLVRDQIFASSNSGSPVVLVGNSAAVFCTYSGVTATDSGLAVAYRMGLVQV